MQKSIKKRRRPTKKEIEAGQRKAIAECEKAFYDGLRPPEDGSLWPRTPNVRPVCFMIKDRRFEGTFPALAETVRSLQGVERTAACIGLLGAIIDLTRMQAAIDVQKCIEVVKEILGPSSPELLAMDPYRKDAELFISMMMAQSIRARRKLFHGRRYASYSGLGWPTKSEPAAAAESGPAAAPSAAVPAGSGSVAPESKAAVA